MNLKRTTALFLTLLFLLVNPAAALHAGEYSDSTQTAAARNPYQINETTSIKNDFYHLDIERVRYKNLDDILRSELVSMLYLDSSLYLYLAMPEDTDYQADYIIINDHKYENGMRLLDTDYNYRKYVFSDFEESPDFQYVISEIGFKNPEGKEIRYTTKRNCKMGLKDGQYFFEQETIHSIVLVGMLLESIYQFENERGVIRDAWNNLWNNTTVKDGDQRSFYYFAFNCFDREINHYFTPDEITEIVIDYTINQYTFSGRQADYKEAALTRTESKIQIVTPETIHVEAHNSSNSNDSPYIYNTIYKLSEAEIKDDDKTANYNTLFTAQQEGFDWVVHFGETQGYRYCESYTNSLFSDSCEIDYTLVEDFSTVSIKYKYEGEKYEVDTDTLVDMEVLTQREKDRTEHLIKQTIDTFSSTLESLGTLFSGAVTAATGFATSLLAGIFRGLPTPLKVIVVFFAAFILVCIAVRISLFIKGLSRKKLTNRKTEE